MPRTPGFKLLSDRGRLPGGDLAPWLARLAAGLAAPGLAAVQIREKDLPDLALYALAKSARAALPAAIRLLVNGRLDVALAAGADGAHLPADAPPLAALRRRFGAGVLLGVSTHRVGEVARARQDGADYAVFGPVYATPGKEGCGPPAGLAELARAVGAAGGGFPVYALGGVTLDRFGEVAAAGAAGAAGIRLFAPPSDQSIGRNVRHERRSDLLRR